MNDFKITYKNVSHEFRRLQNNIKRYNFAQDYWKGYTEMKEGFEDLKKVLERVLY